MPKVKTFPDKTCHACGVAFNRRRMPSGRLEGVTEFLSRSACSLSCANTREELKPKSYLWRSRKFKKTACEACGEKRRLHVHHCDQDQTNNDLSNLQTLCQWCHDFWHATAKRVGRSVAGRMPSLGPQGGKTESPELQAESPLGWTDLKPLGTVRFPDAPLKHGAC